MPRNSIRGWRVWAIKRDLAEGVKTQRQIAAEYDIAQAVVSNFKTAHQDEIDEIKQELADVYAGLWIADKRHRVAAYQDIADEMNDAGRRDGDDPRAYVATVEARRAQMQALRSVADELGQIPARVTIEGGSNPVKHVLEGVDTEDLA